MSWGNYKSLVYYIPTFMEKRRYKIAFLDLDETLITKINPRNPKYKETNYENWIFINGVLKVLRELNTKKWTIVIVSNQSNYDEIFELKIKQIQIFLEETLNFSPFFLIATSKDEFRKPEIGFLRVISSFLNLKIKGIKKIKKLKNENIRKGKIKRSLMCGDAICEFDSNPRYRWSNSDYEFYLNLKNYINIEFWRPDELFESNTEKILDEISEKLIIMVGNQGSGKTTFAEELKNRYNYVVLSKDVLKTDNKVKKLAEQYLLDGFSVVIDATNPSYEIRQKWLNLTSDSAIVWMVRDGRPFNQLREKPIKDVAYNVYSSKFEIPDEDSETKVYKVFT